jgi:hypothetical protein
MYLAVVDRNSNWLSIIKLDKDDMGHIISTIQENFTRWGMAKEINLNNEWCQSLHLRRHARVPHQMGRGTLRLLGLLTPRQQAGRISGQFVQTPPDGQPRTPGNIRPQ